VNTEPDAGLVNATDGGTLLITTAAVAAGDAEVASRTTRLTVKGPSCE
jgi:hypothetical protein